MLLRTQRTEALVTQVVVCNLPPETIRWEGAPALDCTAPMLSSVCKSPLWSSELQPAWRGSKQMAPSAPQGARLLGCWFLHPLLTHTLNSSVVHLVSPLICVQHCSSFLFLFVVSLIPYWLFYSSVFSIFWPLPLTLLSQACLLCFLHSVLPFILSPLLSPYLLHSVIFLPPHKIFSDII